jgi:hypothetical protein
MFSVLALSWEASASRTMSLSAGFCSPVPFAPRPLICAGKEVRKEPRAVEGAPHAAQGRPTPGARHASAAGARLVLLHASLSAS